MPFLFKSAEPGLHGVIQECKWNDLFNIGWAISNTHRHSLYYWDHAQCGWVLKKKKNNNKHALHDINLWYITKKRAVTRYLSLLRLFTIISLCGLFDSWNAPQFDINSESLRTNLPLYLVCGRIINIISLLEDVGEERTRFPLCSSPARLSDSHWAGSNALSVPNGRQCAPATVARPLFLLGDGHSVRVRVRGLYCFSSCGYSGERKVCLSTNFRGGRNNERNLNISLWIWRWGVFGLILIWWWF